MAAAARMPSLSRAGRAARAAAPRRVRARAAGGGFPGMDPNKVRRLPPVASEWRRAARARGRRRPLKHCSRANMIAESPLTRDGRPPGAPRRAAPRRSRRRLPAPPRRR